MQANKEIKKPKRGDLRIWHIPQVPGAAFRASVPDVQSGSALLQVIANYDIFQFENRIKGDYASVQGLEVFDPSDVSEEDGSDGWMEWHCKDGMDVMEHRRAGTVDFASLVWEMDYTPKND